MNKPTVITPPIISNENSMSFSEIASWGKTPIVGVSIAVFIVVLSIGYYFLIDSKLQELSAQKNLQSKQINEFGGKICLSVQQRYLSKTNGRARFNVQFIFRKNAR